MMHQRSEEPAEIEPRNQSTEVWGRSGATTAGLSPEAPARSHRGRADTAPSVRQLAAGAGGSVTPSSLHAKAAVGPRFSTAPRAMLTRDGERDPLGASLRALPPL